ncbi:MAG: DEAD/DEAH box helicase [Planctomycetota bacterium]
MNASRNDALGGIAFLVDHVYAVASNFDRHREFGNLTEMDWLAEDALGSLGLLMGEAIERLVDSHSEDLDARAAMLTVATPTLTQGDHGVRFDFKVRGNRQKQHQVTLSLAADGSDEDGSALASLVATATCTCVVFARNQQCEHTLAAAWWLQEQIARRRGNEDLFEFLGGLKADAIASGRQFVDELLRLSKNSRPKKKAASGLPDDGTDEDSRLQWRLRIAPGAHTTPIAITPYEQRPRKGGRGWTKGREVRSFDLLTQDVFANPIDARVASLTASPVHGLASESSTPMYEALRLLAGHENVAWDDGEASAVAVFDGQLELTLDALLPEELGEAVADTNSPSISKGQRTKADDVPGTPGSNGATSLAVARPKSLAAPPGEDETMHYRPRLCVDGIDLEIEKCEILVGEISPIEPVVVLADRRGHRIVVCTLRNHHAIGVVRYLMRSDFRDTLLDARAASKLTLSAALVDSLLPIKLPPELAGPIVPAESELIIQLRPRPGGGLKVAVRVHDPRFRHVPVPGIGPKLMPCLTSEGPVRVSRGLDAETELADEVVAKFGLDRLMSDGIYSWMAATDHAALELLGRLHTGGSDAPAIVWPDGETFRIRGEITPKSLRVQIDDTPDWFGLSGVVQIDGIDVPLRDLLAAVRDDRQLVRVGDRQFAKISDAFRKRLTQLGDAVTEQSGAMRLSTAALPTAKELLGEDIEIDATAAWHDAMERLDELQSWNPDRPEDLDAQLRDYQLDGYRWLARLSRWGVGGVLADDMGLGKTVQALGVLVERAKGGPALVVAPTSVGDNWLRETHRFAPSLNPVLYRHAEREKLVTSAQSGDVVIVSYQLLQRDAEVFAKRAWHTLVLDEAQFIKNSQTKTAQAIRGLQADWRLGLSGTPLENHLGELWSLFRTLSPGLLGSWQRFRSRFAEPIERHNDEERREALARMVRPFILRRTKDKVLKELPPRTEITLRAELSEQERQLYEDTRLAALAELSGPSDGGAVAGEGQKRIQTLAWLTRLRQLSCHPSLVEPTWTGSSAKLDLFLTLVDELREGDHRALVFSQFVKHLSVIRRALDKRGIAYQYLDGSTPSSERQERVDAFQKGEADLFLISLKAGGTGLNLTAADYVLHLDPWWNPAVEDQATDRAHRIGQQRPVTVYRLVAESTIEEQILQLHADKRELVAGVLDGTDAAGRLKTEDLINLIRQEVS